MCGVRPSATMVVMISSEREEDRDAAASMRVVSALERSAGAAHWFSPGPPGRSLARHLRRLQGTLPRYPPARHGVPFSPAPPSARGRARPLSFPYPRAFPFSSLASSRYLLTQVSFTSLAFARRSFSPAYSRVLFRRVVR